MLAINVIESINSVFHDQYPVTENEKGVLQCGSLISYLKNNFWVIAPADTHVELAALYSKVYAVAYMRIINAFPTLAEKDQAFFRKELMPALVNYIDTVILNKKKKHPGGRPKSPIKRRYKQYWISEEEDLAIKQLLAQMRQKK